METTIKQTTIVDYLTTHGTKLKKEGSGYAAEPCPFCGHKGCGKIGEKNGQQFFKCFSCDEGAADVYSLESKLTGQPYGEVKAKATGNLKRLPNKQRDAVQSNHEKLLQSEHLKWFTEVRGISLKAIRKYKVGLFENDHGPAFTFPFLEKDNRIGNIKFITPEKKMYFKKNGKQFLFGLHLIKDNKKIILTEGELDAMASDSLQLSIPAISVGLGALNWKEEWLDELKGIDEIYICFDSDENGIKGSRLFAEKLGKDRCKIIELPGGHKDMNDYLLSGSADSQEIEQCIINALSLDQLEIIDAIDQIPKNSKIGTVINDVLVKIANRPELEDEDYLSYIKERHDVSFQQRRDFKRQIKAYRKELLKIETKDAEITYQMSDDEKQAALAFLKRNDLLDCIVSYAGKCGLIGEKENFAISYLASVSRKMNDQIHIMLNGAASSGKSEIMNQVVNFTPPEDVLSISSSSAQAFYYLTEDQIDRKLVTLAELDSVNDNQSTMLALRLMLSEKRISKITAARNQETGRINTESQSKNVRSAFVATSNLHPNEIEHQSLSRMMLLTTSDMAEFSEQVNKAILLQQTREYKKFDETREEIKLLLQNSQRLLDPEISVSIEWAPFLNFPARSAASRRALKLFLNTLKAIAFLKQYSHNVETDDSGKKWISVTIDDYKDVFKYLKKVLDSSLSEISERSKRVLEVACLLQHEKKGKRGRKDWAFSELQDMTKKMKLFTNVRSLRDCLYDLTDNELIVVTDGVVGMRGKKLYFRVNVPYEINSETKKIEGLELLNSEITTPEELAEILEDQKNKKV